MGLSVAIIAFALEDAPHLLEEMDWKLTEIQVGQPLDLKEGNWELLLSPEYRALNNPHFSAARTDTHLVVYASLKELGPFAEPDYAALSRVAALTVHVVVDTSNAASIGFWDGGTRVWSVEGTSGEDYDIFGDTPIDLDAQAEAYRTWWNGLPHDDEFSDGSEFDLPKANSDLISEHFSSVIEDYFAKTTGFRSEGDHPPLYRLTGDLPAVTSR